MDARRLATLYSTALCALWAGFTCAAWGELPPSRASEFVNSPQKSTETRRLPPTERPAAAQNVGGGIYAADSERVQSSLGPAYAELEQRLARTQEELRQLRLQQVRPVSATGETRHDFPARSIAEADPSLSERMRIVEEEWQEFLAASRQTSFPTVAVNGVFQADFGWFSQGEANRMAVGDLEDGADFRRARLSAKGSVAANVNYVVQLDFAFFGRPTFTDLWFEVVDLPVLGNFRVGQWKQPFSLEVVTSFRFQTFIERSLLFQSFAPFRHIGAGVYDHAEDLHGTWAFSVFRTGQDQFGGDIGDNGGWSLAGRVTWLPWYDEASDGRGYLHTGLAYNFSDPDNDLSRFATIPEFFVGEVRGGAVGTSGVPVPGAADGTVFFVDTGNIATHTVNKIGTELVVNIGPFAIQSEAMYGRVSQVLGPDLNFAGFYLQGSYFLTGEHRPYDRISGALDRVRPFEDFFRVRTADGIGSGCGAWEVAARWSYLDLNDKNIRGGELNDVTLGVNWYLNAYTKFQFNYIRAMLDDAVFGSSTADIVAVRGQIDF